MKLQQFKQAVKDGVVVLLRVVAALAAVIADGTYWLYDRAQTRFAPPPPKPVKHIRVRQLGVKTGQIVFVRKIKRVNIPVRYVNGSE